MRVKRYKSKEHYIECLKDRFNKRICKNVNGCIEWTLPLQDRGYGRIYYKYDGVKETLSHRVSYILFVGDIPKGMFIDHKCRNRRCVNVKHLRVVTPKQNVTENSTSAGALNKVKTHCPQGHKFNKKNTRVYYGSRYCMVCIKQRHVDSVKI